MVLASLPPVVSWKAPSATVPPVVPPPASEPMVWSLLRVRLTPTASAITTGVAAGSAAAPCNTTPPALITRLPMLLPLPSVSVPAPSLASEPPVMTPVLPAPPLLMVTAAVPALSVPAVSPAALISDMAPLLVTSGALSVMLPPWASNVRPPVPALRVIPAPLFTVMLPAARSVRRLLPRRVAEPSTVMLPLMPPLAVVSTVTGPPSSTSCTVLHSRVWSDRSPPAI